MKTTLVVLLSIAGGAALLFAAALANRLAVLSDIANSSRPRIDVLGPVDLLRRLRDADDYVALTTLLLLAVGIAVAVVLIIWQRRAAKNAEALGRAGPRFGPGWSIGGWFIPLANLVLPVLIFQDLWRASAPGSTRGDAWRDGSGSGLIGWWWALFLAGSLAMQAAGFDAQTVDRLRAWDTAALVGSLLAATSALLLLRVVVRLTERLDSCRREHESRPRDGVGSLQPG